jgi:hypothetical protein
MLVEQEQDLRKLGEHWRMFIHQEDKNTWWVTLSSNKDDMQVQSSASNPKRAWKEAFKKAKEYNESSKKSS